METKELRSKVKEFIGESVRFDKGGAGYFWGVQKNGDVQIIGEVRGWGAIQNLSKDASGKVDFKSAEELQDEMGKFIAEAITEKLNNENK